MYIEQRDTFLETIFTQRFRDAFAGELLPNGTPFADLVAEAIILDRRAAGLGVESLDSLTADQIVDADIDWLIFEADGGTITLPFGTEATSERLGSVKIGARTYVVDAGRPGLHEVESVRRDAHGPNLVRLQELIARRTARLECRRLGVPSGAAVHDNQPRELLQFPPCEQAGGVVLQRTAYESGADRFCAATPTQLADLADAIVADMRKLWSHRKLVAKQVERVRAIAEHTIQEVGTGMPVVLRAIAIDVSMNDDCSDPSLYVEFDGLDEALRPGVALDFAPGRDDGWNAPTVRMQKYRRQDREEFKRLGAGGRIDAVAAAVVAAAPMGAAAALAPLATRLETYLQLPTSLGAMHATLFWLGGTIRAEVDLPGVFSWYQRSLETYRGILPNPVAADLEGRHLAQVPAELLAGCDLINGLSLGPIVYASPLNRGGMRLRFADQDEEQLVNLASGRVW